MNTLNTHTHTQQSMFIWDVIYNRRIKLNFPKFNQANELKSVPMNTRRIFFACIEYVLIAHFCLTFNCTFRVVKQQHSHSKMCTRYAYSLKLCLHDYFFISCRKFQGRVFFDKSYQTNNIHINLRKWWHIFSVDIIQISHTILISAPPKQLKFSMHVKNNLITKKVCVHCSIMFYLYSIVFSFSRTETLYLRNNVKENIGWQSAPPMY